MLTIGCKQIGWLTEVSVWYQKRMSDKNPLPPRREEGEGTIPRPRTICTRHGRTTLPVSAAVVGGRKRIARTDFGRSGRGRGMELSGNRGYGKLRSICSAMWVRQKETSPASRRAASSWGVRLMTSLFLGVTGSASVLA